MVKNNKKEYSKVLLIQESALIWVLTVGLLGLAYLSILKGYTGTLPWLAAMVAFPWTAYGVSQAFYYKKSSLENTKDGIKFESVMAEVNALYNNVPEVDWNIPAAAGSYETQDEPCGNNDEIDLDYGI